MRLAVLVFCLACAARAGEPSAADACFEVDARRVCATLPAKPGSKTLPLPLVVYLHGNGGDASEDAFGFRALVDEERFIFVRPEGVVDETGRRSWNANDVCCFRPGPAGDDVAFLTRVLAEVERRYPVDRSRVYIAGHSLGGFLAQRFGCDHAERVTAVLSHAGALWNDAGQCKPKRPVSVLLLHGDADTNVKYRGGQGSRSGKPYPSAQASFESWARIDGCSGLPVLAEVPLELEHASASSPNQQRMDHCQSGVRVELWTLRGAEHLMAPSLSDARAVFYELSGLSKARAAR